MKSHSVPRYIFLLAQLDDKQGYPTGPLRLISGVLTRWTSLYHSLVRLLHVRTALETLVYGRNYEICCTAGMAMGRTREQKERNRQKAVTILDLLHGREFWLRLEDAKEVLKQLALGANLTQRDSFRMDHICNLLGCLFKFFSVGVLSNRSPQWRVSNKLLSNSE